MASVYPHVKAYWPAIAYRRNFSCCVVPRYTFLLIQPHYWLAEYFSRYKSVPVLPMSQFSPVSPIRNVGMCLKFCEDYFGVHIFINMFPRFLKIPFSRSVESWHALYPYSICRQVEISFLGMPQIAHFQVEKWKSSLPWEGGTPPSHRPPLGRYAPSDLVASLPRKDCAPPNVLAHYATGVGQGGSLPLGQYQGIRATT